MNKFILYYEKDRKEEVIELFDGKVASFSVKEGASSPEFGESLEVTVILVRDDRECMRRIINNCPYITSGKLMADEIVLERFKE